MIPGSRALSSLSCRSAARNAENERTFDGRNADGEEHPRVLRCLIADRSAIFALGLKAALDTEGVAVVGWVDDPSAVASFVRWELVDLVLSCYEPPMAAVDVARRVEGCPVLVLCSLVGDELLVEAARAGARAILSKEASRHELIDAVLRAAKGETVFPARREHAVPPMTEGYRYRGRKGAHLLSKREEEVVQQLVHGFSNKQVARELGIAEQTVKNHVRHIMAKLGLSTRVQLCCWALEATAAVPLHQRIERFEQKDGPVRGRT